ncbi:MAG: FAD-dependent oxidoreductase [Clostridia bacterium]|nr:FAD-dependent oxidoreductase [Clostridia bacterium]
MLDCIIVGSGPAGISAALTLKANGKNFMIFGSPDLSEKISKAELIRNYPGLSNVTGEGFSAALKAQLAEAKIEIKNEKVAGVYALKEKFSVLTQENNAYESKTVILACGVESIKPIDGEEAFLGRGVSYCATCDGFLYKGKTIAVVCTTKRLEHEIVYLADLAEKVYLVALYKDVAPMPKNVTLLKKIPKQIAGERRVERLVFAAPPAENIPADLPVDGVFALRECIAPTVLVGGLEAENGHVKTDKNTATNLKGCFAAGDCTGRPYQYAKAVGEGNIAAHSVVEFLK